MEVVKQVVTICHTDPVVYLKDICIKQCVIGCEMDFIINIYYQYIYVIISAHLSGIHIE